MTLEEIFKEYEKGCGNTCLDGKPSDCKECLDAAVRAVNRYHAAKLTTLRAENERLRCAFTKPDREVLRAVCYGTVCYADEFSEILESYWEALK